MYRNISREGDVAERRMTILA